MAQQIRDLVDTWVIYRSEEDPGMWVAHSLNMDQIALGKTVLEACAALKPVIRSLLEAAEADPTIQVLNPAPKEVRDRLRRAKPLSGDLVNRAEELLRSNRRRAEPREEGVENFKTEFDLTAA